MNIGIFLPNLHSERVKSCLAHIKTIQFHYYTYDTLDKLSKQFQKNKHKVDAYLFSGRLSYVHVKGCEKTFEKPVAYLKLSDADFFKQLFLFSLAHPSLDLSRVVIDFAEESEMIKKFIDELPESQKPYALSAPQAFRDTVYEEGFKLHQQLHKEKQVDMSFTRLLNILPSLQAEEIPYHYFEIPNESIIRQTENLIETVNMQLLKDNQIVSGFLTFQVKDHALIESKALLIHSLLLEYNHLSNQSLVIDRVNHHFELTTNLRSLKEITHSFSKCALISFLTKDNDLIIHIGWGIGTTFKNAELHAQRALELSEDNLISSTFIYQKNGQVIGPLRGTENNDSIVQEWITNSALPEIKGHVNLPESQFNKVILAFNQAGTAQLTSAEFAELLQISVRSANRILKEAEANQLVHAAFEKSSGVQGRPRKIYRLNEGLLEL